MQTNSVNTRNSSFELLRIVAMLFIAFYHLVTYYLYEIPNPEYAQLYTALLPTLHISVMETQDGVDKSSDKFPIIRETSDKISDKLQKIIVYMQGNNGVVTQAEVAEMFKVSDRQARNYLSLLINDGRIIALEQTKIERIL